MSDINEQIKLSLIESIEESLLNETDESFKALLNEMKAYLAAKGYYNNSNRFEKDNVLFGRQIYGILLHEDKAIADNDKKFFQIENEEIVYDYGHGNSKILNNFEKEVLKRLEDLPDDEKRKESLRSLMRMLNGLIDNLNKMNFLTEDLHPIDYKTFVLTYDNELMYGQLIKDKKRFKDYLFDKLNFVKSVYENNYNKEHFKKGTRVIEADIPEKDVLLNLDASFENQSKYVQNGLNNGILKLRKDINKDNVEYSILDFSGKTGLEIYQSIEIFNKKNNPKLVSSQLMFCKNQYDELNPIKGAYKQNKYGSLDFYIFDNKYIKILKIL